MNKTLKMVTLVVCAATAVGIVGCGKKGDAVKASKTPSYEVCMQRVDTCTVGSPLGRDVVKSIIKRRKSQTLSYADNIPDNVADVLLSCGVLGDKPVSESMLNAVKEHGRTSVFAREIAAGIVEYRLGRTPRVPPAAESVIDVVRDCKIFGE